MSVRDLIREVYVERKLDDPRDIAHEVLARMTPQQVESALSEMLPAYTADVCRDFRRPGPIHRQSFKGQPHVSWRLAGIRTHHEQLLAEMYPTENGYRRMAEMTRADLSWTSEQLRQHARETVDRATGFDALAELLHHHQAMTVADLPADALLTWARRQRGAAA